MDKLFQNRKHEKAVRKNGRTDSVSTAHVHMETLENAKEQGKESYQTQMRHMAFHMPKDMPECAEAGISTFVSVKRD